MRTVHFTFIIPPGLAQDGLRVIAEQIVESLRAGALDVRASLVLEEGEVVGLSLSGEYEMAAIASERVRKTLRAHRVTFREEQVSTADDGETTARSLLDDLTRRQSAGSEAGDAEEEALEDEYEEYDLEELTRADYGQYPLTPPHARQKNDRDEEHDALLRSARERLLDTGESGVPRRRSETVEERRKLAFIRGFKSGKAFYRMGLHEDAERNLQAALKLNRAHPELHFYLGLVSDSLGKSEQAERHLRRSIALDPDVGSNHFYLGNMLQKQGRLEKAVVEYKRAVEHDPDVAIIYNNLAWVYYQMSDYDRALRAFETSISMDPDLPFPHNGIACVYQEVGALPDAVSAFRKAIELYPSYAAAHLKLGWCLLQLGDLEPAIQAFTAVLESSDEGEYVASANYSLGHSYLAQGNLMEAQEVFQKVIADEDEDFVDALLHLGIIQLRLGFSANAVTLLRKYIRKAGDAVSEEAWKHLAVAYHQSEQYGSAMRACRHALEGASDDAEIHELMGQIAGAQQKWVAAERHIRRALELSSDSASAWHHLGWVFENRDERDEAVAAYRRAIHRDPEAADSFSALGRMYVEEGKREEALVLYEKALELSPADVVVLNNLGWLHAQGGAFDEALRCYTKALGLEPENSTVRCSVGALFLQMGRREEAERELRRVVQLDNDPRAVAQAHYFLGVLLGMRQNADAACTCFEASIERDPEFAPAWFRLGECLLDQGDLVAARKAFERYIALEPGGEFAGSARQYVLERLAGVTTRRATGVGAQARGKRGTSTRRKKSSSAKPRT